MSGEHTRKSRRRQWGAERRNHPMSIMHARPSARKMLFGRIAILVTVVSWAMYVISTIVRHLVEGESPTLRFVLESVAYLLIVTCLAFSALMYLLARQGALYRFGDHQRVPRELLDAHFSDYDKSVTVLIPSYREEIDVVSKTIWSAALQEFPSIRVVLLIDDPPSAEDRDARSALEAARALPEQIASALRAPVARLTESSQRIHAETRGARPAHSHTAQRVTDDYIFCADWLEARARNHPIADHTDEFFVDRVLMDLAGDLRLTVIALEGAIKQGQAPPRARLRQLHDRLVRVFSAEILSFERKTFASLSHESNKAMNLNSYISLMGGRWDIDRTSVGDFLVPADPAAECDLEVPDSEYLLTLDADSMLLRDYCMRLSYFLEEPGNERVAVTQTPYSAYRGAPSRIERVAGATTDIQHQLHQGMTYYGATFWVGANAVIRKRALEDIADREMVGGYEVTTYIQDRTVIEDTESSIDLGTHGWTLVNYPERLSYSATPPDFGSLIVQRRRWANGGLLILPKFWRQLKERRFRRERVLVREVLLRVNYMGSIAWASFGLLLMLAYPFDSRLMSLWVVAAALPYFLCMAADLHESGHRRSDVFRIYGFNLVLVAVNIAGVSKSIQQAMTNRKIPFARTPKVKNRTAAPGIYVLFPYLIVGFSAYTLYQGILAENWVTAAFAAANMVLCGGAIVAYIGIRYSIIDLTLAVVNWLYVPEKPKRARASRKSGAPEVDVPSPPTRPVDWQGILYHGDRRLGPDVARKNDLRRKVSPR